MKNIYYLYNIYVLFCWKIQAWEFATSTLLLSSLRSTGAAQTGQIDQKMWMVGLLTALNASISGRPWSYFSKHSWTSWCSFRQLLHPNIWNITRTGARRENSATKYKIAGWWDFISSAGKITTHCLKTNSAS